MKVCFERTCTNAATWSLLRPCCKSRDPLCGRHAVARRNALKLLAKLHTDEALRCDNCGQLSTELPTIVEE